MSQACTVEEAKLWRDKCKKRPSVQTLVACGSIPRNTERHPVMETVKCPLNERSNTDDRKLGVSHERNAAS